MGIGLRDKMDEEEFHQLMKFVVPLSMSIVMALTLTFFLGEYRLFPSMDFKSIYISIAILIGIISMTLFVFRFFDRVKERDLDVEYLELQIEDLKDKVKQEKKKNKNLQKKLESLEKGNAAAYVEIFGTENNLRKFVEKKMIKRWSKDRWIQKLPPEVRKKCKTYKEAAKKARKLHYYDKNLSLLAYSQLHQLALIIKDIKNWENVFKELFPRQDDSSIIVGQIETLVPFRDKIAHNRPISSEDLVTIKKTCEIVNKLISD